MYIQTTSARTNRTYRDTIFVDLFGRDRDAKKNFLSLYNALHGTNLTLEQTRIEPVELERALYMGQYNDVSMLVDGRAVILLEHQSTLNENMPLRCLLYIAKIYETLIDTDSRFKRRVCPIPTPEFYVFYNGRDELPPVTELRLSTAFIQNKGSAKDFQLELTVPVYNLNKLEEISAFCHCNALKGYTEFVRIVVQERAKDKVAYMERAVRMAEKAGILTDYLTRKNKEVENMYWGEYDYETDVRVQREEAAYVARLEAARNFLQMGLTAEQVAQGTGLPEQEIASLCAQITAR